uniref:Glycosyl transferase CAP10 domain-containing protein n=1 Tax=Minutocellus polymorphus TaxID=265543 RepID=A0A7S0B2S3_9STRA|eukprot:CAMPEP_0197730804 /NCGR_PEP_ID=MMETSP1434-20131217/35558_1 /TAXON_ID=265543 /ORGANISM="Minutocellus polymorphus, Strain CCMP3303" /LENGTH=123 /DNA_ID=CAMNT_0043317697 /DNA_START=28 /DNA_END=399 /DNA_ORIENTATION=-
MTIEEQLRYKILINLEGNDVSSGLKWMLLSTSVVLMSPPTRTSWAMEELLEPFVHYVPLAENGSNAEEMVRWILDNDEKAQRIAERATLFMEDMLYHPDAEKDEQKIKREIMKRYRAHWTPTP